MAFGRKLGLKKSHQSGSVYPFPVLIASYALRFFQFVLGIAVIGLYAQDLKNAHDEDKYTDSKWAYAVAVGTLGAVTALVYMIPRVPSFWAFGWDVVLFILWAAVFGIFGKMYIHENPEGNGGIKRMKNAVWVDLVNMLLWFFTAIFAGVWFFFFRGGKSRYTGRANV